MKTLALFGASGRTGRHALDEALARGYGVHALVGHPARMAAVAGVQLVAGDAREGATAQAMIAGTDAIVCCLGMRDITVPATDFSDSVRSIVAAAQAAGVRRLIAIASAGVLPHASGGLRSEHGPQGDFANIAAEHRRNYQTLSTSGLAWTLMCPVDLKDDIPPGHARTAHDDLPDGGTETGRADLARTMIALIDDPGSYGKRIGIVSDRR